MVEQNFREAEYGGQRCSQLVRHTSQKKRAVVRDAAQLAVGFFERVAVLLQLFDKMLDLLVLLAHRCGASSVADADNNGRGNKAYAVELGAQAFRENRDGYQCAHKISASVNRNGYARAQASIFKHTPTLQVVSALLARF